MKSISLFTLFMILFIFSPLTACGYKGALYLPDENEDQSKFGPIQTGIGLEPKKSPNKDMKRPDYSPDYEQKDSH